MNPEKVLDALYDLWIKEHNEQIEIKVKKKATTSGEGT